MSMSSPGNSVIVNFFMRFPILIPVAAAVGITMALPEPEPAVATPLPHIEKVQPVAKELPPRQQPPLLPEQVKKKG